MRNTINPHDLIPEALTGKNSFNFIHNGKVIGSYNRPENMDDNWLSNELFDAANDLARCERVLVAAITIRY